jgi:hypothetical protein
MVTSPWLVLCLLVAGSAVAGAQTRILIQPAPKPDQTIHVTTTQEFSFSMGGGAAAAEPAEAQMVTRTVLGYTQSNGRFDGQGRMESQLTIDRIEAEQTLNGSAKSPGNLGQLVGRSLTAVFDRAGRLVDITVPQDLQQASGMLKQLLAGAYGALNFLPATTMAIGETATAPSNIPLRLPGSTGTVPYQTRTLTTLRAVETSGRDRIARLEQRIESAPETDQLKVSGAGTIDVNLDRGFVGASATEWAVTGGNPATASAASAQLPPGHGTIKVTVTATADE